MSGNSPSTGKSRFDEYAEDYEAALGQGLSFTGEDKKYFARGRVAWLADRLRQLKQQPKSAMDFGCGTGLTCALLVELINVESVLGIDSSPKLLEVAKRIYGSGQMQFLLLDQFRPNEEIDLVFCNGVFHHIPPDKRAAAANLIYRSLRRGGLFALWENNPWNPATRFVMSRIPFDRYAKTLTPPDSRCLLRSVGFEILQTDFLFIFPRALSWFRCIEPLVARLPIGAQYEVLCRKP